MAEQYANCTVHHKMHSDRRFDLPDGDVIKVGRTRYLDRRLTSLQTAHHRPLVLFGVTDGDREESLHTHLDSLGKRVRGEWFRLDAETMVLLAAHGITRGG